MVKIMENPNKIDDLGVPLFLENPYIAPWKFGIPSCWEILKDGKISASHGGNIHHTLPKTNSSPLKIGHPKKESTLPSIIFVGASC